MKIHYYILFILLCFLGSEAAFAQHGSSIDSLLKIRENLIANNQLTIQIDRQLIKQAYSPKVVVFKMENLYHFHYYLLIDEAVVKKFEERLLTSFRIKTVNLNPKTLECSVGFFPGATDIDKINFFKAFGYDGMIYKN